MLSQSVKDELRGELEHLRAERQSLVERIDKKIRALEDVLEEGGSQRRLPLGGGVAPGKNGSDGPGFRETLLEVVRAYPTGLAAADIAAKLDAMPGFKLGGTSSTVNRVYGEVSRLKTKGRLLKRGSKYFVPTEKSEGRP